MKKVFSLIFICFLFSSCLKEGNAFVADTVFEVSKPIIKKVFKIQDISLKANDSLFISSVKKRKEVRSLLGTKLSNFLTRNGLSETKTDSTFIGVYWNAIGLDSTKIALKVRKLK